MIHHTRLTGRSLALFFSTLSVAVVLAGCSDDGLGKRYAVSGTVKYNGQPVEKGNITFIPKTNEGNARSAQGVIENGSYTLGTAGEDDGALPGEYLVRIISVDVDMSQVQANAKGGAGRQDDIFKANKSAKRLVPAKYELESTSGLTAKVEEKSNTVDFDLKD